MEAMLLCCGEVGYSRVAVERVYRRYGGCRSQFYRHFRNKADCFVDAYEVEVNRLVDRVVERLEQSGPIEDRIRQALEEIATLAVERPAVSRSLFVEVHLAGPKALDRRREAMGRISDVLDRTCRETASRHSPPPLTGEFLTSAVDQAVSTAILSDNPEAFTEMVPDLVALIRLTYLGGDHPFSE